MADGGFGAMAGIYHRIIRQGVQLICDAIQQLLVMPAGQVRTADTVAEKHIAPDQEALSRTIKAKVGGRMSRGENELQLVLSKGYGTCRRKKCFADR